MRRRGLTLVELMIATTITLLVVGAMGGLARTIRQGYEYSEGYGNVTQHARTMLDRISRTVSQATANASFPGCIVVSETVGSYRYPDTLVVWRPNGAAANPTGLPRFNELVIYCPKPAAPNVLVELTAPGDTRTVPAANDEAAWRTQLAALKTDGNSKMVTLTDLLRSCPAVGASEFRGAARFEVRLRPSATDWSNYLSGTVNWIDLPWVQGIYGPAGGLRQTWVRMEIQLQPKSEAAAAPLDAVPFLGSAALYYQMPHP
jgi:hypothetical protein